MSTLYKQRQRMLSNRHIPKLICRIRRVTIGTSLHSAHFMHQGHCGESSSDLATSLTRLNRLLTLHKYTVFTTAHITRAKLHPSLSSGTWASLAPHAPSLFQTAVNLTSLPDHIAATACKQQQRKVSSGSGMFPPNAFHDLSETSAHADDIFRSLL